MAGVHRLQEVHRLAAAYLADHQPVGSHAQCGSQQVCERDLAQAIGRGVAGLEADHMWMRQPQFGDVLEGDHPGVGFDLAGERVEQRGLARGCRATDQQVAAAVHELAQQGGDRWRGEPFQRHGGCAEPADGEARPVDGDRLDHRAQPGAVG